MAEDSTDLIEVWSRALSRIVDDAAVRPHQRAWLGLTRPLGLVEDTALLAAPNHFAKEYLENRLRPLIQAALSDELGRDIAVAVTVSPLESEPGPAQPAGTTGTAGSSNGTNSNGHSPNGYGVQRALDERVFSQRLLGQRLLRQQLHRHR